MPDPDRASSEAVLSADRYKLKLAGPMLEANQVGGEAILKALQMIGFQTVAHLYEALVADPIAFSRFLALDRKATRKIGNTLCRVTGFKQIGDAKRRSLAELPCSLGLREISLRWGHSGHIRLRAPETADTLESLQLRGVATDPALPGLNMINEMPPIRDQGERGTCVAHSILRCYEVLEKRDTQNAEIDLSEEFLYWNTKEIEGALDAEGSESISYAGNAIVTFGACEEVRWPYHTERFEPEALDLSQRGPRPSNVAFHEARQHRPAEARELLPPGDTDVLKASLAMRNPVAYAIPVFGTWYHSLQTRLDGYLNLPTSWEIPIGAHAITLVGYGVDDKVPGGGYFIFDNSWSAKWGSKSQFGPGRGILPFRYAQLYGEEAYILSLESI